MSIPTSPETPHTTPPYPHSPLLASPHTWLRTQKQSDRNTFIFASLRAFLHLYSESLPFALLLWGKCPCSDLELTNLPPVLGILSLAFSGILRWWQCPPFLPHHRVLLLLCVSPTGIPSLVSPDLTSHSCSRSHSSRPPSQHGFLSCPTGIRLRTSLSLPVQIRLCLTFSPLTSTLPNH